MTLNYDPHSQDIFRMPHEAVELGYVVGPTLEGVSAYDYLKASNDLRSKCGHISDALSSSNWTKVEAALRILDTAVGDVVDLHSTELEAIVSEAPSSSLRFRIVDLLAKSTSLAARDSYRRAVLGILENAQEDDIPAVFERFQRDPGLFPPSEVLSSMYAAFNRPLADIDLQLLAENLWNIARSRGREGATELLQHIAESPLNELTRVTAARLAGRISTELEASLLTAIATEPMTEEEDYKYRNDLVLPKRVTLAVKAGLQMPDFDQIGEELVKVAGGVGVASSSRFLALVALESFPIQAGKHVEMMSYFLSEPRVEGDWIYKGQLMKSIGALFSASLERESFRPALLSFLKDKKLFLAARACDAIGNFWQGQRGDRELVMGVIPLTLCDNETVCNIAVKTLEKITPPDLGPLLVDVATYAKFPHIRDRLNWVGKRG